MVNFKKILRNAFNKTSLDNEDWLEPSGDILEQIEQRIYVKKRRRGWLFLLPILLLLFTAGGVWLNMGTVDTRSEVGQLADNSTIETFPKKENHAENTMIDETDEVESKTTTLSIEKIAIDLNQKKETPIILDQNNISNKIETSTKKPTSVYKKQSVAQQRITSPNSFSTQINSNSIIENTETISNEKVGPIPSLRIAQNSIITERSSFLNPLNLSELKFLTSTSLPSATPPIKVNLEKNTKWSFTVGTSISYWDFKLNENFQTALAPADFQSSNGLGVRAFMGVDREIGRRFSLGTNLAYEQIGFSSGHNSTLAYDRNAETDANSSNTKMVTMATPLGFVESDLVINRNSDVAGNDVLIDIKNNHRIQSLDLQLILNYEAPKILGLTPVVSLGTGIQYISNVSNELKSFTPEQSEFSAGKGAIIANQSSLQRWSPTVTAGFGIEKSINRNLSVGVNGNYLFNTNNLQALNDFSTRLTRLNGGVYLRRKF